MKNVAVFCIPAHGHTNPILPVVTELVKRGNSVRFYSFEEFREKIERTGAEYFSIDAYLPELTKEEEAGLKNVSITEMTIQDIRITLGLNDYLHDEFESFKPDVVYTDSACFWGKLNAWKYDVPMVVSTSTFAFNRLSSTYMKSSPKEIADLLLGMPRCSKELNKLKEYGYKCKGILSLVQSDNDTDSVVYTSKYFQPFSESFSDHYLFAGPSVFSDKVPDKDHDRPLVYISMGTVINDRPDFYAKCIEALKDMDADVVISCGKALEVSSLGELPDNIKVYPYVDQLDILSRTNVFITHCGMNSVSESLYMASPMVLYPQTNEQAAVARRAMEIGAGVELKDDSVEGIKNAVKKILSDRSYADAAQKCSDDFRSCPGPESSAEFIENAPHSSNGVDVMKEYGKADVINQVLYVVLTAVIGFILYRFIGAKFLWIYIVLAVVFGEPIKKKMSMLSYKRIVSHLK